MDDVVEFCSDLIKYESVTPNDNGIIEYIKIFLDNVGKLVIKHNGIVCNSLIELQALLKNIKTR